MDNPGEDRIEEKQQLRPNPKWPIIGVAILILACFLFAALFAWQSGLLPDLALFSGASKPIEITPIPTASGGKTIERQYRWIYGGHSCSLTLQVPESLYGYYIRMERAPVEDYSIYVTHPLDDNFTASIATELRRQAVGQHYDDEETVNFTASFVQNLRYEAEVNEHEYPKYPVETLVDRGGDCEDLAVLTAALLHDMGYDAVLLKFAPPKEDDAGHMAAGVAVTGMLKGQSYRFEGKTYYYLETTSEWPVGTIPDGILSKYDGDADAIYKLVRTPAPRFTDFAWRVESRLFSDDSLNLEVTVTNWGTANAEDLYVRAFFKGQEAKPKSSSSFDLEYCHKISGITVKNLTVPSGGGTLCVELFLNGTKVDDWSKAIV